MFWFIALFGVVAFLVFMPIHIKRRSAKPAVVVKTKPTVDHGPRLAELRAKIKLKADAASMMHAPQATFDAEASSQRMQAQVLIAKAKSLKWTQVFRQ